MSEEVVSGIRDGVQVAGNEVFVGREREPRVVAAVAASKQKVRWPVLNGVETEAFAATLAWFCSFVRWMVRLHSCRVEASGRVRLSALRGVERRGLCPGLSF